MLDVMFENGDIALCAIHRNICYSQFKKIDILTLKRKI